MKPNFQIPNRSFILTHKLMAGSYLYTDIPYQVENMNPPVGSISRADADANVLILEQYIAAKGLYSKIKLENNIYYTLDSNLSVLEEVSSAYKFIQPFDYGDNSFTPEDMDILNWDTVLTNKSFYDQKSQQFYCVVEREYEGDGLTDEQIKEYMEEDYIIGLQVIFKANYKKYKKDYITELSSENYFFGAAKEWYVKTRKCSNFYTLVTFPKRLLESAEIIDYRANPLEAAKDGINKGITNPKTPKDGIKYVARISLLNFDDFAKQIKDISNILKSFAEKQVTYARQACKEYIGSVTVEDYLRETKLNLSEEAKNFAGSEKDGNFVNTIKSLLDTTGVEFSSLQKDSTQNNILFGLDKDFNICYVDVLRKGKIVLLNGQEHIFEKDFGDGGVISQRDGFLIYSGAALTSIFITKESTNWNAEINNNMDYETFVKKFIIPPPKELNLPKKSIDCVKDNLKKLAEDALIETYKGTKELTQVVQWHTNKISALYNEKAKGIGYPTNTMILAGDQIGGTFVSGFNYTTGSIKNAIGDNVGESLGKALGNAGTGAVSEINKVFRRGDFQKALLSYIICQIRDMNNSQFTNNLDKLFNNETKHTIQEWLKQAFCNQMVENIIKAFKAIQIPKFQGLDLNKAVREAVQKAISQLVLEMYAQLIRDVIRALSKCGDRNSPFTPEQELGINDALDNLLSSADDPSTNGGLNDMYDSIGLPEAKPGEDRADEETKKQIKNLVADISCLLTPFEICRLMAEGIITPETFAIIRSVLSRKYEDLDLYLSTPKQITDFFTSLGKAINISEACAALANAPEIVRTYCDDGSLDAALRENLRLNNLTEKQINDLIDDLNKKRQQRMDDVFSAINNDPTRLPILCTNGQPGTINPAKVDPTYAKMVETTLNGVIKPIYKIFDDDAKEWSSRCVKDTLVNFSKEDMSLLANAKTKEDSNIVRELLIHKGILVPDYELDSNGYPDKNKQKKINGELAYKYNDQRPAEPPVIAPILTDTIILKEGQHFEQTVVEKNNKLTFRIISDIERDKFKALAEAQVSADVQKKIRDINTEFVAKFNVMVVNELTSLIAEVVANVSTGGAEDDSGFWTGISAFENYFETWEKGLAFILAGLTEVLNILDIFFVDLVNDPRKRPTPSPIESSDIIASQKGYSARFYQSKQTGQLIVSKASDDLDKISTNTTELGTVDANFYAISNKNQATINKLEEQRNILLDKQDFWQKELENEKPYGKDGFNPEKAVFSEKVIEIARNLEATGSLLNKNEADLKEAKETQKNIDKVTKGSLDMSIFDFVENTVGNYTSYLKVFEDSYILGGAIRILRNCTSLLQETKTKTQDVYSSIENAKNQLLTADNSFPNYEIIYEYGKNKAEMQLKTDDCNLSIRKNNNNLVSSSVDIQQEVDQIAKEYINKNNLFVGFDEKTSAQEYVFKKYLNSKSIDINYYKKIEKQYFDGLYEDIKNSVFYKSSKYSGAYVPNVKRLNMIEGVFTDLDSYCGLNNSSLDIDEAKEEVLNAFIEEACNFQESDSQGNKRNKMNPIENTISDVLIYATLRVYIYDYYLKGIFLFDKYHIGVTATDPMLEFLARCFETEMRNFESSYYESFLANTVKLFDKKFKEESIKINSAFTEEQLNTKEVKNIKFKKMIQKELLYISKRFTQKIDKCLSDLEFDLFNPFLDISPKNMKDKRKFLGLDDPDINIKYNKLGRIFPFFERNQSSNTLQVKQSGVNVVVYYDGTELFRDRVELIKDNPEYRLLFEYCFPIRKYISLVTMQEIMCGNAYLNTARTFAITKSILKTKHNSTMKSRGIYGDNDLNTPSGASTQKPGAGGGFFDTDAYREILIRLLVEIPLQTLKGLCESADPNVFFASLPYRITKPITLALQNQIPIIPAVYHPLEKDIKTTTLSDGTIQTTAVPRMITPSFPMFYTIPALGVALAFTGLFPTPFGILYYALSGIKGTPLWWDDMIQNKQEGVVSAKGSANAMQNMGLEVDLCEIVNKYKNIRKPKINRDELLITEYA
jgi:hypothetical protein